jgi:hypothetical protein
MLCVAIWFIWSLQWKITITLTGTVSFDLLVLVTYEAKDRAEGLGQGLHSQGQGQYSQDQVQGLKNVLKDSARPRTSTADTIP